MKPTLQFDPEVVCMKFKLHDLRKSKVWKEAHDEGDSERLRRIIDTLVRKGKTLEQIAELLEIPLTQIRQNADINSQ